MHTQNIRVIQTYTKEKTRRAEAVAGPNPDYTDPCGCDQHAHLWQLNKDISKLYLIYSKVSDTCLSVWFVVLAITI